MWESRNVHDYHDAGKSTRSVCGNLRFQP